MVRLVLRTELNGIEGSGAVAVGTAVVGRGGGRDARRLFLFDSSLKRIFEG